MTAGQQPPRQPRLLAWISRRTLARLAVMTVASLALYVGLQVAIAFVAPKASGPAHDVGLVGAVLIASLAMLGVYRELVRMLERRRVAELSLVPGAVDFVAGIAWGAVLFVSVILLLAAVGVARFGAFLGVAGLIPALALAVFSAVGEEIIFRGCLFRIVEESAGTLPAILVSAGLFGVAHLFQPGANLVSTVAIALEAGVLLALTFAASRNLWLPIGVHLGWNFTEGGIFSQAVSGGHSQGLVAVTLKGHNLLTGGAFGPEASLVAVAVSLAASLILAWLVVRSGRWRRFGRK